ncbi:SCP-like extracellular protein [Phytophthora infestans T30-4]|uniref:SCP-like extracellular protein n=3 Tax=Phytophthora infestans TaxID=4787 RepID=D0NE52_PHYIT|nr:SCP-like extracellular protein [Phytophthora infestans T30-4]EEY56497.1 SCP-like extracellular protein [Phytophthora infestans T30-4]KAF4140148.1 Cysteine-rich secretory protein family [Phytophthora infestans]|eukprot:XP_002902571.1 SCP-like extracellular protein [Phytophthora infestans T30-4]
MLRLALIAALISVFFPSTTSFQIGSSQKVVWASNCDFPGNDYRSYSSISEVCGDVCASEAVCTHWAWSEYNGGTCWLKKGMPSSKATSYDTICGYVVSRTLTPATTSGISTTDMEEMLAQTNSYRAQNELAVLTVDHRLVVAALLHSQDQASHCNMTHTGTNIKKLGDRVKAQGYRYSVAAENVAAGQTTIEDVMTSWWNSPDHQANILNEKVENVGFAVATNEACSDYKTYWTQDFGRLAG